MKAFVYILQFRESGKFYVGSTIDLERRMQQHKRGHTSTTKRLGTFELVFVQEVDSINQARWTERKIKSWKRRDFIKKLSKMVR